MNFAWERGTNAFHASMTNLTKYGFRQPHNVTILKVIFHLSNNHIFYIKVKFAVQNKYWMMGFLKGGKFKTECFHIKLVFAKTKPWSFTTYSLSWQNRFPLNELSSWKICLNLVIFIVWNITAATEHFKNYAHAYVILFHNVSAFRYSQFTLNCST